LDIYPVHSLGVHQPRDGAALTNDPPKFNVKTLKDSVKFYLPRVEGYLEIVRGMASRYGGMSLIEFDGYFEGKFEPVKYTKVEVHTNDIDEQCMMETANEIRIVLKQKSLAFEFNNKLILVDEP
jgi:hypothetical protein